MKHLPRQLESIDDAIQALDAIHEFLNEREEQSELVQDATGHAADGAWSLAKARLQERTVLA